MFIWEIICVKIGKDKYKGAAKMKKIKWLATGGTISSVETEKGLVPASSDEQMKKMLYVLGFASENICTEQLMNIDSTEISCDDIRNIGIAADKAVRGGFDGIIITHGTDTMAYTAAILDRMMDGCPIPVIITGSQRPFFADDSDGKANLLNALNAACENIGGVHILFGDKLIRGGRAYKAYTRNDNAFISPSGKYSGSISGGKLICSEKKPDGKYIFRSDFSHKAGLIKITPMTRPEEIETAAKLYDGIVIEGYGIGAIPTRLLPAIKRSISGGVKCVLISQCLFEGVSMGVYEVGTQAKDIGVISGSDLTAEGALARLMFGEI